MVKATADGDNPIFATTHWSIVLAAGHSSSPEALAALLRWIAGLLAPTPAARALCS